jgi:hypothetical protein
LRFAKEVALRTLARMAWRIDEAVVRGAIDNRVRGRVTGRIWFVGREEPVDLELAGNAWRDLAGRRLEFTNPQPKAVAHLESLGRKQMGTIGDCTASRRVKVPEVSMDELMELYKQRKPFPWHWGNSLYLEWFSTGNGRVVIESVSFQLTIDPASTWEMTLAEEEAQRRANAEATGAFFERLGKAVSDEQARRAGSASEHDDEAPPENEDETSDAEDNGWESNKPMSEEEAEKMAEENDRLVDRIQARMERAGHDANFEQILDEELEKRRKERGEQPLTPEQEAKRNEWLEEVSRAADEAAANPDPEREDKLDFEHPVAVRAHELTIRLMNEPEARGWVPDNAGEEHPLVDLASTTMKASAKFAGVLNGEEWPPEVEFCASVIVRLKKARSYLGDALLAAEFCAKEGLGDATWIAQVQRELNELAHEGDVMVGELRAKLERGID